MIGVDLLGYVLLRVLLRALAIVTAVGVVAVQLFGWAGGIVFTIAFVIAGLAWLQWRYRP